MVGGDVNNETKIDLFRKIKLTSDEGSQNFDAKSSLIEKIT